MPQNPVNLDKTKGLAERLNFFRKSITFVWIVRFQNESVHSIALEKAFPMMCLD